MKKLLFLFWLVICVGLFSACERKVAVTSVNEEQFPSVVATEDLTAVPFAVRLPTGWTVREESLVYTLAFDEGASGYIQVLKTPLEEWPGDYPLAESGVGVTMVCRSVELNKYCAVRVKGDEAVYSVVLTDKAMSAERRMEAEGILKVVRADGWAGSGEVGAWREVQVGSFVTQVPEDWRVVEEVGEVWLRSGQGAEELRFETSPTEHSFHELFDAGYVTVVEKSMGVWAVCTDESWSRCVVQDLAAPELYEFSVKRAEDLEAVRRVIERLRLH